MRVLLCNATDTGGGAAVAARRLHAALLNQGVDSHMAVLEKRMDLPFSGTTKGRLGRALHPILRTRHHLPLLLYPGRGGSVLFSSELFPCFTYRQINRSGQDITHLHWISDGMLTPFALGRLAGPVVWTLHDEWAFTGGCHFRNGCQGYTARCGRCPQLGSRHALDISRLSFSQKRRAYARLAPVIVTPSKHLAERARQSTLLSGCRIESIPNPIDLTTYRPIDRNTARELLQLPKGRKLIAFGSVKATSDARKGFDLLTETMGSLGARDDIDCLVFGASHGPELPLRTHWLGYLGDAISKALVYSAADLFICPSREENLPNTIMESLACGTPVAAFHVGGIPEMVTHELTGWLAPPFDCRDLAHGIARILDDRNLAEPMSAAARNKAVAEYDSKLIARRHMELYAQLLDNSRD